MKNLFTFLFLLFSLLSCQKEITSSQNGGVTIFPAVTPQPQPVTNYSDIYFLDENIGYIGGSNSLVLYTTDGGLTWKDNSIKNVAVSISKIIFYNKSIGFILVNGNQIFKTTDGGEHWVSAYYSVINAHYQPLWNIKINNGTIYIVGGEGTLAYSKDSGTTWGSLPSYMITLYGINFNSKGDFIVSGQLSSENLVYHEQCGTSFSPFYQISDWLQDAAFNTDSTGCFSSDKMYTFKVDKKQKNITYNQIEKFEFEDYLIDHITFISKDSGYALGRNLANPSSVIIQTTDGGKSWGLFKSFNNQIIESILIRKNVLWYVGFNRMVGTIQL